jgi:hypothetical protein
MEARFRVSEELTSGVVRLAPGRPLLSVLMMRMGEKMNLPLEFSAVKFRSRSCIARVPASMETLGFAQARR